jgi:hypothetical protein
MKVETTEIALALFVASEGIAVGVTKEFSVAALKVKAIILAEDRQIFRIGTRGTNKTGNRAQFWAQEHPGNPVSVQDTAFHKLILKEWTSLKLEELSPALPS